MTSGHHRRTSQRLGAAVVVLLCGAEMGAAYAWSIGITPASRRVFLHVGNGTLNANNATINLVQLSLTAAQLLGGGALPMTENSTQTHSLLDGHHTCPTAGQVMIGASYRRSNSADGPASATLSVTSPLNLSSLGGDTIPFSEISWTVAAPGSPVPNVIPAGTFTGATQTLTTVPANRYIENCHSFFFSNSALRAAGTFTGRVTYTLSTL